MSTFQSSDETRICHKGQLVEKLRESVRPSSCFKVGLEIEKIPVDLNNRPLPYFAEGGPSIKAILLYLRDRLSGEAVLENGKPIAVKTRYGMISLEPGGQVELATPPCRDLLELRGYVEVIFQLFDEVAQRFGFKWWNIGFHPIASLDDIFLMPKERYKIMAEYLPRRASRPLEMMFQSACLQATFDYSSEGDMVEKFRLSQALSPILIAMYANSPLKEGRLTGYQSYRAVVWEDVDPDRTLLLKEAFEADFGFERYVDILLRMPMMFVIREGRWLPTHGISFLEFMEKGFQGYRATIGDWELHTTGLFTDVRLRPWLEVRSPDMVCHRILLSFPAFLKGLLYSQESRERSWHRLGHPDFQTVFRARREAAKWGLKGRFGGEEILGIARDLLDYSVRGLEEAGGGEEEFLAPLDSLLSKGKSPSERLLEACQSVEGGGFDLASGLRYLDLRC